MVILRPATMADAEQLLRWRNDSETRTQSLSQAEVPLVDHLNWLSATLARPATSRLYIAEENGCAVGTGRLDLDESMAELSLTVAPEHRGRGLARQIIHLLIAEAGQLGRVVALAQVKGRNARSLAAFLASGFLPSSPEALIRLERPISPDDVCPWCAAGNPHHWMAEGSIGGPRARAALDMHEIEDTGGAGLRECLAAPLLRVEGKQVRSCG